MDSENTVITQGADNIDVKRNEHNIEIKEELDDSFISVEIEHDCEKVNIQEISDSGMNINSNQDYHVNINQEADIPFVSVGIEENNFVEDADSIFFKEEENLKECETNSFLQAEAENVSRISLKIFLFFYYLQVTDKF